MRLERYADWPSRLNAYLAAVQKKIPEEGLDYGTFDCVVFVADAIVEMTGEDLFKARGKYKTKIGAGRMLKRLGGMEGALASVLGPNVPAAMAAHGDIVVLDGACGICMGRNSLYLSDGGFSYIPTLKAECAFHV
ncbi:DUF6950 family protein [Paremcibacter congregatus]|uniref:DUF6950 family protein n=1 Tax=Paremcibacter congregatus TaxID=2043170 RepID=UPI0030EF96C3